MNEERRWESGARWAEEDSYSPTIVICYKGKDDKETGGKKEVSGYISKTLVKQGENTEQQSDKEEQERQNTLTTAVQFTQRTKGKKAVKIHNNRTAHKSSIKSRNPGNSNWPQLEKQTRPMMTLKPLRLQRSAFKVDPQIITNHYFPKS